MAWDDVLDQLDLPSLGAFTRYWKRHPPVHVLVAAYLGVESADEPPQQRPPPDAAALEELMAMFPETPR